MIPASGTHYVHFKKGSSGYAPIHPVAAWDDDGAPLVVSRGRLRPAYELGEVERVVQDFSPVVGAVPGGGWLIDCVDSDGNTWTSPILAWTIHADGSAIPITSDSDGLTSDATEGLESYRVYHPETTDLLPPGTTAASE